MKWREVDPPPAPIAIIGMACMFAQAPDLRTFWNNILAGVDAIGEPVESWDAKRYLDAPTTDARALGREVMRLPAPEVFEEVPLSP